MLTFYVKNGNILAEDRNGCLHGEDDGKFVAKTDTDKKAYDSKDNFGELKKKVENKTKRQPDETIPKSIGAKWANEEIIMPDGSIANFVEGSKVTHREVFAGAGVKTPIRDIDRLVKQYPKSEAKLWQKVKGHARLIQDGEEFDAEIHWYEEPSVGRVETKHKKYLE